MWNNFSIAVAWFITVLRRMNDIRASRRRSSVTSTRGRRATGDFNDQIIIRRDNRLSTSSTRHGSSQDFFILLLLRALWMYCVTRMFYYLLTFILFFIFVLFLDYKVLKIVIFSRSKIFTYFLEIFCNSKHTQYISIFVYTTKKWKKRKEKKK